MPVLAHQHHTCRTEKNPKCTSSRPITRSKQQNLPVQPEEPDPSSNDEEDQFMSMISSQAPGDDPKTTVLLKTAEQVYAVESVHSLSDNIENMTVDDSQEDDTATAPGPDVEVGDNLSDGDEPEDSQQIQRPQRSRLTYCWPNIAAVKEGWYQLSVPPVMGQIYFSPLQVRLCLDQKMQALQLLNV